MTFDTSTIRGVVTLTHTSQGRVEYTPEDYQTMADLGANHQSIRLHASLIGAWLGRYTNPEYLDHLERMVDLAANVGMSTSFKLTLYDVRPDWRSLWLNEHGEQDAILAGWRTVWQRFRGNPNVIGYDLLNEPEQGTLGVNTEAFVVMSLNPFYQRTIDWLHEIDDTKLALIQPPMAMPRYTAAIDRGRVIYAPHFYPNFVQYLQGDTSLTGYSTMMDAFVQDAKALGCSLLIGEYGMPWQPWADGDVDYIEVHAELEQTAVDLFLMHRVGFIRPWAWDDTAAVPIAGVPWSWSLYRGTQGLKPENRRTWIIDAGFTPRAVGPETEPLPESTPIPVPEPEPLLEPDPVPALRRSGLLARVVRAFVRRERR